jgi:FMN phosphatase YigB (HAD superfamily)
MSNSYSAIIFDLGGVVLNLNYDLTVKAFQELSKENFAALYAQSQQDKIFDLFEIGHITASEFRDYMRSFLGTSFSDEIIDKAWNAMLLDLPLQRIELIAQLKKYYKVYLFSNTNEIHLKAFKTIIAEQHGDSELLEKLFDQAYYSHVVGKRKPNAEAFETVLNQHELVASETLFIDDSIQHIEGAQKLGLQTIHLVNRDIVDLNLLPATL